MSCGIDMIMQNIQFEYEEYSRNIFSLPHNNVLKLNNFTIEEYFIVQALGKEYMD